MPRCLFAFFFALLFAAPLRAQTPPENAPKTLVVALGGVSWDDWATLAAPQSPDPKKAFPNLHRVLQEGALGAAQLRARNENPLLQTAMVLSAGLDGFTVPWEAAQTMGRNEGANESEKGIAAQIFVRRTGKAPKPGQLFNLGQHFLPHEAGRLAEAVKKAGGRAVAIGNSDVPRQDRVVRFRDWALIASDSDGLTGGNVGPQLLRADPFSPYGTRAAHIPTVLAVLAGLQSPDVRLISLDWGDTRRAAHYETQTSPRLAKYFRFLALKRFDYILRSILPRMRRQDRLILVAIPDLKKGVQTLPVVVWKRDGKGGILEIDGGEGFSTVGRFGQLLAFQMGTESDFETYCQGVKAEERLALFAARIAAQSWLEKARDGVEGVWSLLFGAALAVSLMARRIGTRRWAGAAKWFWGAALVWPVLGYLAGLYLDSFRHAPSGDWVESLAFSVLAIAILTLVRCWFGPSLRRELIAFSWLLFTVGGASLGGFAMPWNTLFSPVEGAQIPKWWATNLVGATLLGVAGLVQTRGTGPRIRNPRPATLWLFAVFGGLCWAGEWVAAGIAGLVFGLFLIKIWTAREGTSWVLSVPRWFWRGYLWILAALWCWEKAPLKPDFVRNGGALAVLALAFALGALWLVFSRPQSPRPAFAARAALGAAVAGAVLALLFWGGGAASSLLFWALLGVFWED